jgi:hypothetical protein
VKPATRLVGGRLGSVLRPVDTLRPVCDPPARSAGLNALHERAGQVALAAAKDVWIVACFQGRRLEPKCVSPKAVIAGQVLQISHRAVPDKGVDPATGTTIPMRGDTDIAPQEVQAARQS